MTRKKKAASPRVKDGKQTLKAADTAGADYAHEQISGGYFADWVYDQLANPPANPLPLATKADARVIARNMLQQLEWDTKRELEPHTILGLSGASSGGGARSKEVVAAFYKGFDRVLKDPKVVDWLADEILSAGRQERVAETKGRRGIYHDTAAQEGDYVVHVNHRGVFVVDRVGRGGTHTTIGPTRGYNTVREALSEAARDSHVQGNLAGVVFFSHGDDMNQIGNIQGSRFVPGGGDTIADVERFVANLRRGAGETSEPAVVHDYIAVDRNDRRIAGPFRSRHEAERHVPPGGYVKFSSATRRQAPPPPSSYPMFRARAPKKTDRRGQKRR